MLQINNINNIEQSLDSRRYIQYLFESSGVYIFGIYKDGKLEFKLFLERKPLRVLQRYYLYVKNSNGEFVHDYNISDFSLKTTNSFATFVEEIILPKCLS